ncbi:MAG: tetratricopeptide repeat protein [Planctomycetota bacterium]
MNPQVTQSRGRSGSLPQIPTIPAQVVALALLLAGFTGCDSAPPAPATIAANRVVAPVLRKFIDQTVSAVAAAPDNARLHGRLGMVYEANGLYEAAAQSYRNAASLEGDNPSWPLHEAICYIQNGAIERADTILSRLVNDDSTFGPAWFWLGSLRVGRGDLDGAMTAFRNAQRVAANSPAVIVAIAHCHVGKRQHQQAVDLLAPIIEQLSGYRPAHYVLGLAYKGLGLRQKSMRHLRRGVDAPPFALDDAVAIELRRYKTSVSSVMENAIGLMQQGAPEQAVTLLERALTQLPGEVSLLNNLASAYQRTGNYPKALQILAQAEQLEPLNFRTQINRSVVLQRQKDLPGALAAAEAACSYAPQVAEGHVEKARVLLQMRNVDAAFLPLQTAVDLAPDHPWANQQLGGYHSRAQRWAEANQAYRRALPNAGNRQAVIVGLARSYAHLGDLPRARNYLERVRKNWPKDQNIGPIDQLIRSKE